MRRLLRDWLAVLALAVVVLSVLAALGAPLIPGDPYDNDLSMSMQPPSAEHWLGLRLTLLMGAVSVVAGGGIGTALGLFAAFYRRIDGLVMRCMDVLLSFPAILFGLAIAAIAGPGVTAVILALTVATIPLAARIVRGVAVGEMARDYIEAARATGLRDSRLIVKHLLPNCFSALSVWATLRFGQVILLGAALSFVGLGAQPPTAELGAMAAAGRNFLFFAPHIAIIPSVAIFVIVLAFNVLGDALRDLLDPRLRNLGD